MAYTPNNPNGQSTSANSAPVVIANDQSAIPINGTVTANAGTNLNTSTLVLDDTIVLLSRILKTLESLSIIDSSQRQRITLDAISAALTLGTVTTVTNQTSVAGMDREMYINQARTAYNTGIRVKIN